MSHCTLPGCESVVRAKGLCGTHYNKAWRAGKPECVEVNCKRTQQARGLCDTHYQRALRAGALPETSVECDVCGVRFSPYRSHAIYCSPACTFLARRARRYRITHVDYRRTLAEQGGACAICGDVPAPGTVLHIDHDHKTGLFRSLLCGLCNPMLGNAKDNPERLRRGAEYLEAHASATTGAVA